MAAGRFLEPSRRQSLAILAGAILPGSAVAAPLRIVLATATPGGGFPAYGAAFAAAITRTDASLVIIPEASGGSAENVDRLARGAVDLGLVQGAYAYPALGRADGPTILAPMYSTPGLFVTQASSSVRSVADLKGRAVILGTRSSGLTVMGRAVIAASGLDPDHDIQPIYVDHAGDGPAMVRDGRAAALWGGGIGWPGFVTLASDPAGARFIAPADEVITRLMKGDASLSRLTVPANTFPGQDQPIATVGSWSFILARPGFDSDTANRIVGALAHALPELRQRHPQGGESDPRNLLGLVPTSWLNPGTVRFLTTDSGQRDKSSRPPD